MIENKIGRSFNKFEIRISIILILLTLQYVGFYYISESILPRFLLYVFYFVAFLLPILLVRKIKVFSSTYRSFFLFSFFLMFLISFFYLQKDTGDSVACFAIYIQLFSAYFFSKFSLDFLGKVLIYISIIALLSLPYILSINKISIAVAINRGYTWTEIFYYAPLFWGVVPFVLLATLRKKNVLLSFAYWIGAIILNLIFLKRFIIIDSLILFFAIFIINLLITRKLLNTLKIFGIFFTLIGSLLYFKGNDIMLLLNSTDARIQATSRDIGEFNRFEESENYLREASFLDILIGKGFDGTQSGLGREAEALHVGWINFILKGGIIFFIICILPFLKLIPMTFHLRSYPLKIQFSYWMLVVYSFRLLYINMHNLTPELLFFFYAVFNIMDYPIRPLHHKRLLNS